MVFFTNWEDFEKAAERLYLQDPLKVRFSFSSFFFHLARCQNPSQKLLYKYILQFQARFVTQYDHSKGSLGMKMTDDVACIQFKTDAAQDVRRMEKFVNNLMRHMASKEHN